MCLVRCEGVERGSVGQGLLTLPSSQLVRIAESVGTPVYVYNAGDIRAQWNRLADALAGVPHRVHYSVKANSNLSVLRLLRELGAGVDIVSGGELSRVLHAGFSGSEIVFSGVGKTRSELRRAVDAEIALINVESDVEFRTLADVISSSRGSANVGVRVNPNITTETHPYTQTGHSGLKFGVPLDQVADLAMEIARTDGVTLCGLGMHLGSQIEDASRYEAGIERLIGLASALRERGVDSIRSLDIGGGFAISYGSRPELDLSGLTRGVRRIHAETGLTTLLEPGRFLTGNAGVLLTRVQYRKASGGRSFVIIDAGMNDFVRPSYYQAFHDIAVVTRGRVSDEGSSETVDVVGPICESSDFQALDRTLPAVGEGALLAICGAGAYGFSMSSTYNSRPRAAEVLVDSGRFALIREREAEQDLWRGEPSALVWRDAGETPGQRKESIA